MTSDQSIGPDWHARIEKAVWFAALYLALSAGVQNGYGQAPLRGSVSALAIDPLSTSTVYAGTNAGVFKSSNAGASWGTINSGLINLVIRSLAIDPSAPAILYAGTNGGLFKSSNAGASWAAVNSGLTNQIVISLAVDPSTRSTLYAGTYGGGVFKSANAGASWSAVNSGLSDLGAIVFSLAIDPSAPATLYAVAGTNDGVFKTLNGGTSWSAVNSGLNRPVTSLAIAPSDPATLYAGVLNGVFKTSNGGAIWSSVNSGIPSTMVIVTSLAVDPSAPTTVYAGTNDGTVFKSSNGAASWQPTGANFRNGAGPSVVDNGRGGGRTPAPTAFPPLPLPPNFNNPFGEPIPVSGPVAPPTGGGAIAALRDPQTGIEFVKIAPGTFQMGCSERDSACRDNEKPAHPVIISKGFELGKYPVTQAQWQAVMGTNPSHFKGGNLPVENVNWNDAQDFIQKLNARDDGYRYRLPTEAEWEYAARAGTQGPYAGDLNAVAWYGMNSGRTTHPVGQKQANAWGLYDMQGNIFEWVEDRYSATYYTAAAATDPKGPPTGSLHVLRAGYWDSSASNVRVSYRFDERPANRNDYVGFRLLREGGQPAAANLANGVPAARTVAKIGGDSQSGIAGQLLRYPLVVAITNVYGVPVAGVNVDFAVTAGGGTLSGTQSITDASGVASSKLTLGPIAGANTVTVTAAGVAGGRLTFTAIARPTAP